nr:MAG TPA: hypothetical protein [Caudoviricetes sp.]
MFHPANNYVIVDVLLITYFYMFPYSSDYIFIFNITC